MKRIGISMSVIHNGVKYAAGYVFDERHLIFSCQNPLFGAREPYKSPPFKMGKGWMFTAGKVEKMIKKHFCL